MHCIASRFQGDGALVITLEGWAIVMVGVTVRFDHDSLQGPIEVNEMVLNQDIDLGHRKAGFATQS